MDYLLPIGAAIYALLALVKDWEGHKHSWRRIAVLVTILVIGIGSGINTYSTNRKHDDDQIRIAGLENAVRTANKNQEDNTKIFADNITKLTKEVSDLQNKINTVELREEAAKLKAALDSTSKALNPPKATLALSLGQPEQGIPHKNIVLPVKNNIVHVEFCIMNLSPFVAQKPSVLIEICRGCEFASEPKDFNKTPGQLSTQRDRSFDRMLPLSLSPMMEIDIKVPSGASSINLGMVYRCDNCVIQKITENRGVIALLR